MYVETLSEVAVSPSEDPSLIDEIEPMTIPLEIQTPLRPDVVHEFGLDDNGTPKVLNGAPDVLYDGYKVPAIL
jgi:Asp-tRNA(Asn)/Glu-tRNA(Gln) amidotransferase C subunit